MYSPSANSTNEDIDISGRVSPNLWTGSLSVDLGIRRILKLIEHLAHAYYKSLCHLFGYEDDNISEFW